MTSVLIKGGRQSEDTGTQVMRKAETEVMVMHLQPKEHLGLPEARRGKGGSFLRDFRGNTALPTSDFRLLVSRTLR